MTSLGRDCPRCRERYDADPEERALPGIVVERTNRASGEPFWGCSLWPACTWTMPLPEAVRMRRAGATALPGFDLDGGD